MGSKLIILRSQSLSRYGPVSHFVTQPFSRSPPFIKQLSIYDQVWPEKSIPDTSHSQVIAKSSEGVLRQRLSTMPPG